MPQGERKVIKLCSLNELSTTITSGFVYAIYLENL